VLVRQPHKNNRGDIKVRQSKAITKQLELQISYSFCSEVWKNSNVQGNVNVVR